jgi:hypothetical protein
VVQSGSGSHMERTGSLRGYQRVDKKILAREIKIYQ